MAISETKGQERSYLYPVKEGQRYINLNPGRIFVQQPSKKGKGSRGSFSWRGESDGVIADSSHLKKAIKWM